MDERMKGNLDLLEREKAAADASQSSGKSPFYQPMPRDDGSTHDNRIVVLLWKPAIVCPEIFGQFYEKETWDFKAGVKGHWVGENPATFVLCQPGTADYYEKWLGKKFDHGHCEYCEKNDKPNLRYLLEVFDYEKLIGDRPLDQGEERPSIQLYNGPQTVYNQLWSKLKVGIEFWGEKIVRMTKDTRKGNRFAEYVVEVEGQLPEELKNPSIREYLDNPANLLNPVPGLIKLPGMPLNKAGGGSGYEAPSARYDNSQQRTPMTGGQPASAPASSQAAKPKVRW